MHTVNPKEYIAPGTAFHTFLGWFALLTLGPFFILLTILGTYGVALIAWIIALVTISSRGRRALAQVRGSAVQVGEDQFPEIYQATRAMAETLDMRQCPEVYIIEDNSQNAFAVKIGSSQCVLLIDDIVYGALATGNNNVLNFIIAHELAHHALGHTRMFRHLITRYLPSLSRLDELTCDAVAHAVVRDVDASRDALTLLLVGPHLFQSVNIDALDRQAADVAANSYTKKAEKTLTHPLLLRRYAALLHRDTGRPAHYGQVEAAEVRR